MRSRNYCLRYAKKVYKMSMATKIKTLTREQLEAEFLEAVSGLNREQRQQVAGMLFQQLDMTDVVQRMEYVVRAAFWRCNYHLFDYLRQQGQLGREQGAIDQDVKIFLKDVLLRLHDGKVVNDD